MNEPVNNYPLQFPMPLNRFLKRLDLYAMEKQVENPYRADCGSFETSFITILVAYLPVLLGINRKEYKNETS